MRIINVNPIPSSIFEELGFYWYTTPETPNYVADELVVITEAEGEVYYRAANELYDMFIEAGQYAIDHDLYDLFDIPRNLKEMIEVSWEDESHFHMIGRFDFAGGIDGKPIKLVEFNADTPFMVFEIALIQWMILKHNKMKEENQFNSLYETLKESFIRLKRLHPYFEKHAEEIPHALFSCLYSSIEDENTTRLFEQIAYEAGFITDFEYVDKVYFSSNEGIFKKNGEEDVKFDYWFKPIPYEYIGREEPELAGILTDILKNKLAILLNPPYALLFQSKSILKILYDLFPGHPLLLETNFEPLKDKACVEKKTLGREGANVRILDASGNTLLNTPGDYETYRSIYQEYVDLPVDTQGRLYQAGVFFSYEACGLGFRREKGIIQDRSQFVGHFIKNFP
jgi:glutathionylspermidine synthase